VGPPPTDFTLELRFGSANWVDPIWWTVDGFLGGIVCVIYDSQDDSQAGGRLRTITDDYGLRPCIAERVRTLADVCGWPPRGLQNRLRGAARRPGWVRFPSVPATCCRADSQKRRGVYRRVASYILV
jgi:hypothetical protein